MSTYSAYDVFMVRQMSLAVLAAVYLMAVQVDVVREPHGLNSCADCADLLWYQGVEMGI
jgi:hypothetical protein